MRIKLSERLMCIANMASDAKSAADIGCDHGRLSVYLAQCGLKVIAVDISPQSLHKTELLSARRGVSALIDCRLGDGLQVIEPGEACAIIISGIGQRNISEILKKGESVARSSDFVVLQPMDGSMLLRKELCHQGYVIEHEALSKEGRRLHPVIKAVKTDKKIELSAAELALGPRLLESEDKYLHEYLLEQLRIYISIAEGLKKADDMHKEELNSTMEIIDAIGDILNGDKSNRCI